MTADDRAVEVRVGALHALPDGRGVGVEAAGRRLVVFRQGDAVIALDGTCPHAGGPIAQGLVRDGIVTCPWHWWRFRLDTGERLGAPHIRLCHYEVAVRDGVVYVLVPPPPPAVPLRERLLARARGSHDV